MSIAKAVLSEAYRRTTAPAPKPEIRGSLETGERTLRSDEGGAIMIMGLFMAVLAIGVMFYLFGIGEALVYKEIMQDAADTGAFAGALIHARGMNLIALMNAIMAAALAILILLKAVEFLLMTATIIATAICAGCGPYCGFCCAACPFISPLESGWDAVSEIIEAVEPVIEAIIEAADGAANAISIGYPLAANAKVYQYGDEVYAPTTDFGIPLPLGQSLPVENEDSDIMCDKASEQAGRLGARALGLFPIERFVGTAIGALASNYCDDYPEHAWKVEDDRELGDEGFQIVAIMKADETPFEYSESRVAVATWGREDQLRRYTLMETLAEYSLAQAEYYYDDGSASREEDREEWLWNARWRARLRRFDASSVTGGSVVPSQLMSLGDAVVH